MRVGSQNSEVRIQVKSNKIKVVGNELPNYEFRLSKSAIPNPKSAIKKVPNPSPVSP